VEGDGAAGKLAIDGRGHHGLGLRKRGNRLNRSRGGFNCLNWPRKEEGKVEGRPGAAAPGRLSSGEKKKKGKGRGEADRRGPVVSVRGKKRKERRVTVRCGMG
jgi:hypothetical protein